MIQFIILHFDCDYFNLLRCSFHFIFLFSFSNNCLLFYIYIQVVTPNCMTYIILWGHDSMSVNCKSSKCQ